MGTRREANTHCHFHPTELIVGVCALCVNERLLNLASEQAHHNLIKRIQRAHKGMPEGFTFSSFPQNHIKLITESSAGAQRNASSITEEVFIPVKFGDDGNRLWDKGSSSRRRLEICNPTSTYCFNKARRRSMSLVEHTRSPTRTLCWQKRADHLLKLMIGKIQV